MKLEEKELMERYIYQVVSRVPKEQREEISMELQELISDMMEQGKSIDVVLTELGNPREFAKKYREDVNCLIGPEYYDIYCWFLKVVIACAVIPIFVIALVTGIGENAISPEKDYVAIGISAVALGVSNAITESIVSAISAFGMVTLIFAIMERMKLKMDLKKKEMWTPNLLSAIPKDKAIISKGDCIVSIVFIVIISAIFIFAPYFFSAILKVEESRVIVPLLNLDKWSMILPVLVISLLIGLVDEVLRLVVGTYGKGVMISNIVCGILQIVCSVIVFKILPLWNPNFVTEIKENVGDKLGDVTELLTSFDGNMASNGFLFFIILLTLIEMGVTVYRTVRYGVK